ncbi:hypothetical protein ACMYYO_02685 [Dermacoccaceae bacterium W4C1]
MRDYDADSGGQHQYYDRFGLTPDGKPFNPQSQDPSAGDPHRSDQQPPSESGGGGKRVLIAIAVVVSLALISGGIYLGLNSGGGSVASLPEPGTESVQKSARPSASSSPAASAPAPLITGWNVNTGPRTATRGGGAKIAAFDYPSTSGTLPGGGKKALWSDQPETTLGVIVGTDIAAVNGPAVFGQGFCATDSSSNFGYVGWGASSEDPPEAANSVAQKWVSILARNSSGETVQDDAVAAVKTVQVNGGTTQAAQVRQTMKASDTGEKNKQRCSTNPRELIVTAFPASGQTVVIVMMRAVGSQPSIDDATTDKIISSMRPLS